MTIDEKLDLVLAKLEALEDDVESVKEMIRTTADHEDMTEVKDTLDYLSNQFEDFEQQKTLQEIRGSLQRVS